MMKQNRHLKRVQVTLPPDVYEIVQKLMAYPAISISSLLASIICSHEQELRSLRESLEQRLLQVRKS